MLFIDPQLSNGNVDYFSDPKQLIGKETAHYISVHDTVHPSDLTEQIRDKGTAEMLIYEGHNFENDGKGQDAIDKYLLATKLDPHDRRAWEGLARLYDQMGQQKAAARMKTKASECPAYNFAQLAFHLNNNESYEKALAVANAGVADDPTNRKCWDELERALRGLGANGTANQLKKPQP